MLLTASPVNNHFYQAKVLDSFDGEMTLLSIFPGNKCSSGPADAKLVTTACHLRIYL